MSKAQFQSFTLAEVLITLTIIGVIASLTIPNLIHKHYEQEAVTKVKKAFSVISNAYQQAIRENGTPDEWGIGENPYTNEGSEKFYKYLEPYLKIEKKCATNSGCFANSYKALFSSSSYFGANTIQGWSRFQLADGMSVSITNERLSDCKRNITCASALIDINNLKGPNQLGVDLFMANFTFENFLPVGYECKGLSCYNGNSCVYKNTSNRNGAACATWVLYKGNMDYLRRDISSEWK